jgi:hypothetical protein
MKNILKFCLLLYASIFIGCKSDDDNSQVYNPISEFKIDGNTSYATPNGYYTQYELEGKKDNFLLYFIDGKLVPITNPEDGVPCPWVENMTQGIKILFRSTLDDEIAAGIYNYTTQNGETGISSTSQAFYGFELDNQCYSKTEEDLNITDGEMIIFKENEQYTITYSFTSENGKTINGVYYGKLEKHLASEW